MAVFVVAHGAWSAAWAWKKMRPLLRAAGHELWTPTYTGLGERAHLASPAIDLYTHIADVIGMLEMEDLRDVVLIAHSYGGMVATGVADRVRERIAQLVYLDAFVPRDGQSLFDLQPAEARTRMREEGARGGEAFHAPAHAVEQRAERCAQCDIGVEDMHHRLRQREGGIAAAVGNAARLAADRREPGNPRERAAGCVARLLVHDDSTARRDDEHARNRRRLHI